MDKIRDHIRRIGEEMLLSHPHYPDVALDRQKGILPRDLIFDENGGSGQSRGCLVVGLNPGFSDAPEQAYYRKYGSTYQAIVDYWNLRVKDVPYYSKLRAFVDAFGIKGPVLWTEVVHCEMVNDKIPLSDATILDSAKRYLARELTPIPADWPIIAVGVGKPFQVLTAGKPYQILAEKFANRRIIGIPHPTGSFGQFARLFSNGVVELEAKLYLDKLLATTAPYAKAYRCPKNGNCRFQ